MWVAPGCQNGSDGWKAVANYLEFKRLALQRELLWGKALVKIVRVS